MGREYLFRGRSFDSRRSDALAVLFWLLFYDFDMKRKRKKKKKELLCHLLPLNEKEKEYIYMCVGFKRNKSPMMADDEARRDSQTVR